jgi:hypothetical protein
MKRHPKNMAASVRQRLRTLAEETGRPFSEVLQYFAMERFLYRLSQSPHAQRFVLKGALMFTVWRAPASRPTKDIDLLGKIQNRIETVAAAVRAVCRQEVEPDGLIFDAESVIGKKIKEDADYGGVRVLFRGSLENARIPMQIDIGFGDVVTPAAARMEYPSLLDDFAPALVYGYSRESAVA